MDDSFEYLLASLLSNVRRRKIGQQIFKNKRKASPLN